MNKEKDLAELKKMCRLLDSPKGKAWGRWWNKFAPTFNSWFWEKRTATQADLVKSYLNAFVAGADWQKKKTRGEKHV